MAQSLTTLNVEFASGTTQAMPMHLDGTTYYPVLHDGVAELGGCLSYSLILANTTNATSVKAAIGMVYGVHVSSIASAATICIKFYDLAVAPTVGTSTIKRRIVIPAGAATTGSRFDIQFPKGIAFTTGIAFAATTEQTDAGTTAVAATSYILELDYA